HTPLLPPAGSFTFRHLGHRSRRGPAVALAAPVLVLFPPGRVHHDPAGHGHGLRYHLHVCPPAPVRLPGDGVFDRRDRRPRLYRVGPPHVPERHGPAPGHRVHDRHHHDRVTLGRESVQLAGNALAPRSPVYHRHVERPGLCEFVRHRRLERHLHGGDAGRRVHPRHLFYRRPPALRALHEQHLRYLRRDSLLVSQDVWPDDERNVGQVPFRVDVYFIQLRVLPDAHSGRGGVAAPDHGSLAQPV